MSELTSPQAFAASVAKHHDRIAVIGEDGSQLTYGELDALRRRAAKSLIARGVKAGDRVAIWSPNNVEWIIAGLAIHSVGAALVPINTRMRGNEAAYVLERSGARVLFSAGRFLNQHYPTMLAPHRPVSLAEIVVIERAEDDDLDWPAFLAKGDGIADEAVDALAAAVQPGDCLDVLFTSGRSDEHTSELQSLMRISYAVFCLQK